jgi:hypothetical protein
MGGCLRCTAPVYVVVVVVLRVCVSGLLLLQESPQRIDAILSQLHSLEKFQEGDLAFSTEFPLADETAVKRAHSSDYFDLVRLCCAAVCAGLWFRVCAGT